MPVEQQVGILFALINGHLDDIELPRIAAFEAGFHSYMVSNHRDLLSKIAESGDVADDTAEALNAAITEFKANVPY